ncbi:unnamed protein product [Closterium sp. Naga37s-1]|nr:unnamed protein product [Closterium sp. Naga37s-1]
MSSLLPFSRLLTSLFLVVAMACGARGATPVAPATGGRYITVGSTSEKFNYAWNPKVNYANWASTDENTVYTGDVLVFNYPAYSDEVYKFDDITAFQRGAAAMAAAAIVGGGNGATTST